MTTHMDDAIRLARQLNEIASDQRARAKMVDGARKELALIDAKTCDDAAALLQKFGTEVTRLRAGIGCYLYGRLERHELRQMTETWNGDAGTL